MTASLSPSFLEVIDESHMHHDRAGAESHFKVLVVSEVFVGLSRVARQRKIYDILAQPMKEGIHALALRTLTPQEYDSQSSNQKTEFETPDCAHQSHKHK